MARIALWLMVCGLLAGASRCNKDEDDGGNGTEEGGGSAGTGDTGGEPGGDIGNTSGERCGPNVCPDGQVCCNASCGICAPPDGACIQIACL